MCFNICVWVPGAEVMVVTEETVVEGTVVVTEGTGVMVLVTTKSSRVLT